MSVDVRQTFDISEQTQLNHPLGSARGARGAELFGPGGGGRSVRTYAARSLSFYSHYLLTFDLNGVALLKFKQNDYRRNGIKLGYRNEKTVFEWPSLSSRRPNRNSKHSAAARTRTASRLARTMPAPCTTVKNRYRNTLLSTNSHCSWP